MDKLNPGILHGPERKSLAAVMFQVEGERENTMERRGITGWKRRECHREGKRDDTTSWPCQPCPRFLHYSPFFSPKKRWEKWKKQEHSPLKLKPSNDHLNLAKIRRCHLGNLLGIRRERQSQAGLQIPRKMGENPGEVWLQLNPTLFQHHPKHPGQNK